MASILITGASSGIGKELALQLIKKNNRVWVIARNADKLQMLGKEISHPDFYYSVCDVSINQDISALKNQLEQKGFLPDVLILNAGVTSASAEVNHSVNYEGVVNVWHVFKNVIREKKGTVAVTGSLFALVPAPFNPSYSQSKLDALQFLETLSEEKENKGVRFKYFVLGPIHTKPDETLSITKSWIIPSAANTAAHMIKHLGRGHLINIFPLSSKAMIALNAILPQPLMTRLMTVLKR